MARVDATEAEVERVALLLSRGGVTYCLLAADTYYNPYKPVEATFYTFASDTLVVSTYLERDSLVLPLTHAHHHDSETADVVELRCWLTGSSERTSSRR